MMSLTRQSALSIFQPGTFSVKRARNSVLNLSSFKSTPFPARIRGICKVIREMMVHFAKCGLFSFRPFSLKKPFAECDFESVRETVPLEISACKASELHANSFRKKKRG